MHSHETIPDRKGSGISRHGTTKVSLLFLRGKANHGKSYYNLPPLYVCRQQELSTYLSLEYRKAIASHRLPPERTIAFAN